MRWYRWNRVGFLFSKALRERAVPGGISVAEGKPHLYDLFLKSGTEEWEKNVQPGFDFVERFFQYDIVL